MIETTEKNRSFQEVPEGEGHDDSRFLFILVLTWEHLSEGRLEADERSVTIDQGLVHLFYQDRPFVQEIISFDNSCRT